MNRSNDVTLAGLISGAGSLTKQGAGTLTLSGANSYGGVTTVSGGGLQISSDGNLGLSPVALTTGKLVLNGGSLMASETFTLSNLRGITLAADSALAVASGKTLTYLGVITDGASSYALTKAGSGALVLGAAQTYDGLTSVTGGTLRLGAGASLNGGAGGLSLATGTTLDIQSNALTLGSLSMAGTAAIINGAGSSSLTVTGASVLANTITTTGHQIYNGAVTLAEDTNLVTTSNGSITFNSTLDSVSAASPKNLSANISSSTYYWVDWTSVNDAAKTVTGTVTIDGTVITVVYSNPQGWAGVQTSGGTNYWTGSPSPYTSALVANGPASTDIIRLQYAGTQSLTFSESVENVAFSVVSLNGNGYGFNQDFTIASYAGFNGAGSGFYGTGTLSKSYDSATQQYKLLGTSGEPHGTIRFVNSTTNLSWTSLSNENWNGFTVGVNSTTSTIGKLQLNGVTGGSAAVGNITTNSAFKTTAEIASAQSVAVTKTSQIGGNITTTAAQTYAGDATLTSNATLNGTVINLAAVNLAANGLTLNNSAASQISGVVSGTGSITKQGTGSLKLNGANTYSGGTTVSSGLLWVNASTTGTAGAITSSAVGRGQVTVASGAALDLGGYSLANTLSLSGTGISTSGALYNSTSTAATLSGAITLGADAVIKGNTGDLTLSGAVNGAFALAVLTDNKTIMQSGVIGASAAPTSLTWNAGSGNITLGASVTANGPVSITGGDLALNSNLVSTHASTGNVTVDTTGLTGTGGIQLANGRAFTLTQSGNSTYAGAITGIGASLNKAGAGALYLTGESSYSGGTTISSGYLELNMGGRMVGDIVNQAQLAFNQNANLTYSGLISGTGSVVKYGSNILSLSANNTYSGTTTIAAGTLQIGAGGTTGSMGTGALSNSGTLSFNRSDDITLTGVLSGIGSLQQTGTGKLILAAENTYSGNTTISTGTLQVGLGGVAGKLGTGAVINNALLTFDRSDNITVANAIGGTGALTKLGVNTLTLTANNTYSGTTTINAGTLVLQNDAPNPISKTFAGSGALRIESSANNFTNAFSTAGWNFGNTLTGLTLGKVGNSANITLANAITVAGPITVLGGKIELVNDVTVTTSDQLRLIASKDIVASAGVDLSTQGGNMTLSANSDGSAGGGILMTGATVRTHGGNITLGGGLDGSGYAEGSADGAVGQRYRGVWIDQTTLDASGSSANGNVAIRGKGWQGADWVSPATADYAIGIDVVTNTVIKTGGAGTVLIDGIGGKNNRSDSHGVGVNLFNGPQIYTDSGAITLIGSAGTGLARERSGILMDGGNTASIYSTSGAISLTGIAAVNETGIKFNAGVNLGWNGTSGNTTGALTLNANAMTPGSGLVMKTAGGLTIQSVGDSFSSAFSTSGWSFGSTLGGLTIGKASNTANITLANATSVAGAVSLLGAVVTLSDNLTTTNASTGDISITTTGLTGTGGVTLADGRTLTVTQSGTSSFGGVVNGAGAALVKAGAGTLTLSGAPIQRDVVGDDCSGHSTQIAISRHLQHTTTEGGAALVGVGGMAQHQNATTCFGQTACA